AFNPGWYWDTGLYGYTWLPGGGPFFSPFGWGFYSPRYIYGGGLIYGGYGYRGGYARPVSAAHSNVAVGGFHGSSFGGGASRAGGHR
ncbi:MAG TPA: hypothetical protein VGD62_01400, partial [Acidobacteriaceae bacterium]